MKLSYKDKDYRISFCSYFIPSFDLETETLFKQLKQKIDGKKPNGLIVQLKTALLEKTKLGQKIESHLYPYLNRIREVRQTKATVYCYQDEQEVSEGITTQWIGDADSKLLGKKKALRKALLNLDEEFRQLVWKAFLKEFKISDSEV